MKQLNNDMLCKWCLGCNKLLIDDFQGLRNCNIFIAGYENWSDMFMKALKGEKDAGNNKKSKKQKRN